jgi:thiamine-phosphate pyrophosphorylase
MTALPAPLLVITDRHQAKHPIETIADEVGQGGGRWLLLRDKDLDPEMRRGLAARLAAIARRHDMVLSVSRDIDLAEEVAAAGIHLQSAAVVGEARRRLGADAVIGVSAHGPGDVTAAAAAGADYVTLSPIFVTASKPGYGPALGIAAIAAAAHRGIPILALGGIVVDTIAPCIEAGAAGVAVMGEIMRSDDPRRTVRALRRACDDAMHRHPSGQ